MSYTSTIRSKIRNKIIEFLATEEGRFMYNDLHSELFYIDRGIEIYIEPNQLRLTGEFGEPIVADVFTYETGSNKEKNKLGIVLPIKSVLRDNKLNQLLK